MPGSLLGNAVRRVEDPEILVGHATYVEDLPASAFGDQTPLRLTFVRSTVAHAEVRSVDVTGAAAMPGVIAVFTAADLDLPAHHGLAVLNAACPRPPLATDRVRFVGDAVAVVVAETRTAGADAAEAVVVEYEPLPAVADLETAVAPDAPLQFPDLGSNIALGIRDPEGPDPFEGAEVVVRARIENQRVAVAPLEGNAIAVMPHEPGGDHDFTAYVATQMPHAWQAMSAELFKLDQARVRVVTPHVGGAFGGKAGVVPEHTVAVAVARRLGRPVRWVESRSENLVAMPHGRGQVQWIEMGVRRDGTITGLWCRILGDAGAYAGFGGGLAAWTTRLMAQGPYRIGRVRYDVASVLTNTTPMGAFRGAGRPEAAAFLERIVDMAAAEIGMDPVEFRRRNFLQPDDFPVQTVMGANYDSGDYGAALDEAVRLAGYDELRADQAERRRSGATRQLGIGVSAYVEVTAGGGNSEYGSVEIGDDGSATISVGTSAHGQGHATAFSTLVSDRLGIPLDQIRFVQSDTALVPRGGGTGGSRSLQMGGSAVAAAADAVLERAKSIVAEHLEASSADIVVGDDGDGRVSLHVAGVPTRSLSWAELAAEATKAGDPLAAALDFEQAGATFPFGAHIAVVEVDTETGSVRPVRHIAVDDCGRILNPLLVAGQQHGGIAQGIGQALLEQVVYDPDGNPLTSTLADYAFPSAVEFCSFEAANTQTPSPLNPLGAKGIGESGTIGSTPAVHNAVVDALSHLGIRHLDMPCTPERIWRIVRDARAGRAPIPWREPPAVFSSLPVKETSPPDEAVDI